MFSLNPTSPFGRATPFRIATVADANYTPHDFTVNVTTLPSHGMVLKEDGITQVGLWQMVTAAELAALKFSPASAQAGFAIGSTMKAQLAA